MGLRQGIGLRLQESGIKRRIYFYNKSNKTIIYILKGIKMKFNITLFAFFIFCISAFAQVPRYITHQGFLTKPSGAPYDTTIAMTFRVYLDSSGGTSIYEQTISSVSVSKGIFNVALGSLSLAFDKQYYIEVQAGNQTLSPRVKLSSSAYALRADTAANLPAASNIFFIIPPGNAG